MSAFDAALTALDSEAARPVSPELAGALGRLARALAEAPARLVLDPDRARRLSVQCLTRSTESAVAIADEPGALPRLIGWSRVIPGERTWIFAARPAEPGRPAAVTGWRVEARPEPGAGERRAVRVDLFHPMTLAMALSVVEALLWRP